jgi:hypothetical protein
MRNILYLEPSTFSDPANVAVTTPPPVVIVPPPPPVPTVNIWTTAVIQNGKVFAITIRSSAVLTVDLNVFYHIIYTNPDDGITYEFDGSITLPKNKTIQSGTYVIGAGGYGYGKLKGGTTVGCFPTSAHPNPAGGTNLLFGFPGLDE